MSSPHPTEGELLILRVLWSRKEPTTVREVHQVLSRNKDTAYTTVLKMLTIMADKGLIRRAFSGSALKLVQRALDDDTASAEDLDAISRLIAEAKAKRKQG